MARRVSWGAVFVMLVAGFGPVTKGGHAAAAAEGLPSSDSLPERCDTAELAVSERYDPVAGPDGAMTPLLLVHGLDSSADMWSGMISYSTHQGSSDVEQNLVEQFLRQDGVAAYTFDYHYQSQRWIDDHAIAGRLGDAVDCLEATFGRPVIVVGHSMGGLALRYVANSNDAAGQPRASKLGLAITFGTPYDGSLLLLLARGATDVGAAYAPKVGLLRLLLATCGRAASYDRGLCPVPLVNSVYSEAGDGLTYGSAQLAALDPWPSGIETHALAGSIEVVGTTGLFYNRRETRVDLGDIAVTTDSASADAVHNRNWSCEYANNAVASALDATGVLIGVVSKVERRRYSIEMVASACFHTRLTNTTQMTNEAIGIVNDYLANAPTPPASPRPDPDASTFADRPFSDVASDICQIVTADEMAVLNDRPLPTGEVLDNSPPESRTCGYLSTTDDDPGAGLTCHDHTVLDDSVEFFRNPGVVQVGSDRSDRVEMLTNSSGQFAFWTTTTVCVVWSIDPHSDVPVQVIDDIAERLLIG